MTNRMPRNSADGLQPQAIQLGGLCTLESDSHARGTWHCAEGLISTIIRPLGRELIDAEGLKQGRLHEVVVVLVQLDTESEEMRRQLTAENNEL
mmetsp:Transcript_33760/g.89400  ORF Transcript_33760/g.89400 Transcript_33760/m.89400 type:complete len:94 (+) Transcript_33760:181-462(+)